ncbi:MAG: oligoribonuclease [Gammaproteobacteria bacterium]|uniref:Oligoribonuclease n=1 Tax=Marinobacter nitratireducens TaxID=1137280 RepID=A0A072N3I3_9GAMM|nr:oligoribonuclease [Marinobacter nitratireducens]KEF31528.1 3'-to-5' oligoribonuclease (orn) [Marinobacter nitratireducens]TNE82624.1 MAG: oligoribonuclease [Gammaproteobacteria bacterium]
MAENDRLVWIDLEMTGLDPEKERIIEIATIVTDSELNLVAEGPVIAVHQPDSLLDAMDEWCTNTHGANGLTQRVKESSTSEAEAEQQTLDFLAKYLEPGKSPLCGNSIGQDRRFLVKYMPKLEAFFHYRNLDVSTIKELARRWRPDVLAGVKKQGSHLALDDIRDSINELRHYREQFFKL